MKTIITILVLSSSLYAGEIVINNPVGYGKAASDTRYVNSPTEATGQTFTGSITAGSMTVTNSVVNIPLGVIGPSNNATTASGIRIGDSADRLIIGYADTPYTIPEGLVTSQIIAQPSYLTLAPRGSVDSAIRFMTPNIGPSGMVERMRIISGGNVGIGDDSPDAKLDVAGTGIFDGILTAGSGMTFFSRTKAEILAIDPVTVGESYYCSNCTTSTLCISTGTAVADFSDIGDRTAACN